jgi:general secretion pathway protein K
MNTVLAQWEQDLAAVQESQIVPALVCDGATVRLTRRTDKGLQVVAWALRPSTTHSTWWRWAAPPVTTVAELRANWARSQQLQGGEPEQLRTLEGLGSWLVYFYRGNAWSNCQSTAELRAVPGSAASAPLLQPPPDGVRMVLNFAPGRRPEWKHHPRLGAEAMKRDVSRSALAMATAWKADSGASSASASSYSSLPLFSSLSSSSSLSGGRDAADPRRSPASRCRHTQAGRLRKGTVSGPQRGAALLTAMIIVTLVATLTSAMVWQQWRAVQVEAAERGRAQSGWILVGALDWARLILKEDGRTSADVDHLGEPWAVPLAEARLSTFLAADKDNTGDGPEAFMAGSIVDAQSRYNLSNVLIADEAGAKAARATLKRLCDTLNMPTGTADFVANALVAAQAAGNPGADVAAPLMPRSASQLGWLGLDPEVVRVLAPYVVLLPPSTPINVNTASREVLVAVIDKLDLATRNGWCRCGSARRSRPWTA